MSDSESRFDHSPAATAAARIVDAVEQIIVDSEKDVRPMEVDPYRGRLFELFVTADGAGLIPDDSQTGTSNDDSRAAAADLSADALCRKLAERWGLDTAARESAAQQTRLPGDQLGRMRLLWSVMRMWMEWSYAWRRWNEFHSDETETSNEG